MEFRMTTLVIDVRLGIQQVDYTVSHTKLSDGTIRNTTDYPFGWHYQGSEVVLEPVNFDYSVFVPNVGLVSLYPMLPVYDSHGAVDYLAYGSFNDYVRREYEEITSFNEMGQTQSGFISRIEYYQLEYLKVLSTSFSYVDNSLVDGLRSQYAIEEVPDGFVKFTTSVEGQTPYTTTYIYNGRDYASSYKLFYELDAELSVTAPASIDEGDDASKPTPLIFTIQRSGDIEGPLVVNWTLSGLDAALNAGLFMSAASRASDFESKPLGSIVLHDESGLRITGTATLASHQTNFLVKFGVSSDLQPEIGERLRFEISAIDGEGASLSDSVIVTIGNGGDGERSYESLRAWAISAAQGPTDQALVKDAHELLSEERNLFNVDDPGLAEASRYWYAVRLHFEDPTFLAFLNHKILFRPIPFIPLEPDIRMADFYDYYKRITKSLVPDDYERFVPFLQTTDAPASWPTDAQREAFLEGSSVNLWPERRGCFAERR
jgi:hypothetical protein